MKAFFFREDRKFPLPIYEVAADDITKVWIMPIGWMGSDRERTFFLESLFDIAVYREREEIVG